MQPYIPDTLPLTPQQTNTDILLVPLGAASRALARFDGSVMALRNPELLLSPLLSHEAVLSSRIEGTQATLDEVLQADAEGDQNPEKRNDIREVQNYRAAIYIGIDAARRRGLSQSLLRELHQRLMSGVRGGDKRPGAFRNTQNWIGAQGQKIERARYVPPNPVVMNDAMANWEDYVANGWRDPIIGTAIAHAQFEIIHPFNDGNGRVGRMIIPLMLAQTKVIRTPNFYVSGYFEANRQEYYDRLLAITEEGDWTGWIKFFCEGVVAQAEDNLSRAIALQDLWTEMSEAIPEVTHSQYAIPALNAFFERPVMNAPQFQRAIGAEGRPTGLKLLNQLEGAGLITRVSRGAGRRPSRYAMMRVIAAAEGLG